MEMMTLEELKAKNAEEEAELQHEPQSVDEEAEPEAVDVETEETEEDAETSDEEAVKAETESWMDDAEDQDSDSDDKAPESVPRVSHVKTVKKLKGKIRERDSELERLQQENERLKQGSPIQAAEKPKPSRDDFYDHDDPDAAYMDALTDWKLEQREVVQRQSEAERAAQLAAEEAKRKIESTVNGHYERAERLIGEVGIAPDAYQAADTRVREAADAVMSGMGDAVVDTLIAQVGEGSEKLFYFLGKNEAALAKFQNCLIKDKSGLSACMYLGELKASKLSPSKKTSAAPKPSSVPKGDAGSSTAPEKAIRAKYNKAVKSGDWQSRMAARAEAKAAGLDVNSW